MHDPQDANLGERHVSQAAQPVHGSGPGTEHSDQSPYFTVPFPISWVFVGEKQIQTNGRWLMNVWQLAQFSVLRLKGSEQQ